MGTCNCFLLTILVVAIGKYGGSDAARILGVFPLNGKSHFMMGEALMRGLAARGHQVDVISHFPLDNPPPNYRDISLVGSLPDTLNNLTLEEAEQFAGGNGGGMVGMDVTHQLDYCRNIGAPEVMKIINNPPTNPPYDALVVELFAADCWVALGRHLKVPVVGMVTSKLYDWINDPLGNPHNMAIVSSCFSRYTHHMDFFERALNVLIVNYVKMRFWWSVPVQLPSVEKYFNRSMSSMSELYEDISLVLVNTHLTFDGVRPMIPGIVEVGGLHVRASDEELSPEIQKWLDESTQGVVYFAFGSMVKIETFPIETIQAIYQAFARIAPVRVLMKITNEYELPEGVPKNVMTSRWFPQSRVLQHKNVKAFVTHGGLMSTQEAITYGVPMIGVPIFADQYINVRLCEENNVAISMGYRDITADSFTKALNTILQNSTYRENAKRLSKLYTDRPMSAMDTATFWVEYVIRNGQVLRSPSDKLTWWQLQLLDVYAFLITVFLIALYVGKLLFVIVKDAWHAKYNVSQSGESYRITSKTKKVL